MFQEVTHVIFDLDGLLIDSEPIYDKVIDDIAAQFGKKYTLDARMKMLGTPEQDTIRLAISLLELPISEEEFGNQYRTKLRVELENPPLMKGAEKLISHLSKHGIPIAIATSGSKEATDIKLKNYSDLFNLFHHKVFGSSDKEVKKGKPNPDIFLICASRFDDTPLPVKCLVFEDAPNGVTGAKAANMQVVMVPGEDTKKELCDNATLVLKSLLDFQPELFGLPKY